ncbi:CTD small phosphatase-like protein 3 [Cyclopterus lumpus]|uniref:CTD (carboxy-terminal domain, RNA polymerase II, polypeptide A) small phosphatase like 3 n=1 Tax=Cyclopterus lumpus TaxID=8103 RepID=A0A8C2X681_CYCLU|nr:CTD small phosphatase-like protein 3 [Cyclopterus lumpus]
MRLRSQKAVNVTPSVETPRTNRRLSNKATPRETKDNETLDSGSHHSDDEIPIMTRRPMPRSRPRKRAIAVDDRETDMAFKTPIRSSMRHERILSEIDPVSPRNTTARNIYLPIVRFLTPTKENVKCAGNNVLMSPEQGMFGFGSIDLLAAEEEDDIFNPFTFIKNIPSQSQHSQPQLIDIPPKTRSTPEATLVVDLEETLMFSSLNVIEEAEYTFHTTFQDHQYKVYMILRPHVKEFLQSMAKIYELFVYTCAKKEYAEKILNILDPQRKLFRHRLYQDDCACVLGHYIKDLSILGRDAAKTVVLDNAPHTYPYHLMNTIPIKSWSGESEDRELQKLVPYMEKLSAAEDFREVLKKRKDHFHRLLSED